MIKQEFEAVIRKMPDMDAMYVEFPFSVEKVFGKKRMKVKAWFDGELYCGTVMRMGMDCDWLGITLEIRKKIGKTQGDKVHVIIQEDSDERKVEIPGDLKKILDKHQEEYHFFQKLSFTNQKEYVNWIESARKEETRNSRLLQTLVKLQLKKRNPSEK